MAEELVKEMQKGEDGEISCSTVVVVNMESRVPMGRSCHLVCRAGVCSRENHGGVKMTNQKKPLLNRPSRTPKSIPKRF